MQSIRILDYESEDEASQVKIAEWMIISQMFLAAARQLRHFLAAALNVTGCIHPHQLHAIYHHPRLPLSATIYHSTNLVADP